MNVEKLNSRLVSLEVSQFDYSIGMIKDDRLCIIQRGNLWEVFFCERNLKPKLKKFDKEVDACEYFLELTHKYLIEK